MSTDTAELVRRDPLTFTECKRRIAEFVVENGVDMSASKVSRLGKRLHKRGLRFTDEDLERIIMHSDPTPREAIRNVMQEAA